MSLPAGGHWPPKSLSVVSPKLAEWDAWYSGDPDKLRAVYGRTSATSFDRVSQHRGGLSGAIARMWWGRPVGDLAKRSDQLHVPLASDLCQATSDLLFSEPPTIKVADQVTQEWLDKISADLHSTLAEAAEIGAALGGVYLRVTWDASISPEPFVTIMHADSAVPEFQWNRLQAVTFWRVVAVEGQRYLRHLERHETDSAGIGIILHGLYSGTEDQLGVPVPLAEHPSTAGLATLVDENSSISTLSPGLAVIYIPNQRPQRRWRTDPVGANLGRSNLDGVETLLDALDETYSSWMRDIRLAKARLIVPGFMLENLGIGQGARFDTDQEIFTPLAIPPQDSSDTQITAQQFDIRFQEHSATVDKLVSTILRTVGFSQQTFGEGGDGSAVTATEITSRERRSYMTRDRQIRLYRPGVANTVVKLLAVANAVFGIKVVVEPPNVVFADAVQADPEALARTAQSLRLAQAASTTTLVAMQHPDWDEAAIKEEADLILAEQGMSVPDPTSVTDSTSAPDPTVA